MPKFAIAESRRLTLPLDAVVDAVLELNHERGGWMSVCKIIEAKLESGEEGGLLLALQPPGLAPIERHRFSLAAIAAAVIHYLWKRRIPLPRNWAKRLEIVPEGILFSLQGSTEMQPWHGSLPQAVSTAAPAREHPQPDAAVTEAAMAEPHAAALAPA